MSEFISSSKWPLAITTFTSGFSFFINDLSKPLLSRFTVLEIPEYTYEEFKTISVRIIKKYLQNIVILIQYGKQAAKI